jgi:hypothetical protein
MQESSIVLVFFFPVLECRRTLVLNYDVQLQVFEVAPSLFMVELRKAHGDTLEYHNVCTFCISSSKLVLYSQTFSRLTWIVSLLLEEIYTKLFKLVRAMKSGQVEEELCS